MGCISKTKNNQENSSCDVRVGNRSGPSRVLFERQNNVLVRRVTTASPPTQSALASEMQVSQQLISLQLKRNVLKRLKKPKVHRINEATQEKRYRRSWPLYRSLSCDRWQKIVTVDEALFTVNVAGVQCEYQYIHKDANRNELQPREISNFAPSVIVFAGVSFAGVTRPIFVEPGSVISSEYYINKVLKPFIKDVNQRLYPNGDWKLHQDSAPSHTAKKTLEFLREQKIDFF